MVEKISREEYERAEGITEEFKKAAAAGEITKRGQEMEVDVKADQELDPDTSIESVDGSKGVEIESIENFDILEPKIIKVLIEAHGLQKGDLGIRLEGLREIHQLLEAIATHLNIDFLKLDRASEKAVSGTIDEDSQKKFLTIVAGYQELIKRLINRSVMLIELDDKIAKMKNELKQIVAKM